MPVGGSLRKKRGGRESTSFSPPFSFVFVGGCRGFPESGGQQKKKKSCHSHRFQSPTPANWRKKKFFYRSSDYQSARPGKGEYGFSAGSAQFAPKVEGIQFRALSHPISQIAKLIGGGKLFPGGTRGVVFCGEGRKEGGMRDNFATLSSSSLFRETDVWQAERKGEGRDRGGISLMRKS